MAFREIKPEDDQKLFEGLAAYESVREETSPHSGQSHHLPASLRNLFSKTGAIQFRILNTEIMLAYDIYNKEEA